jgi:methyl-accepting chemotaxis protein
MNIRNNWEKRTVPGDNLHVAVDSLHEYADALEKLGKQFENIRNYMHQTACDKSGFTGLLTILQPGVDLVGSLFNETLNFGHDRMQGTVQAVRDSANHYNDQEQKVTGLFNQILDGMENGVRQGKQAVSGGLNQAKGFTDSQMPGAWDMGKKAINEHVANTQAKKQEAQG